MNTNYRLVQDQILMSLLKQKETNIISRKLGYKFNQVNRWMSHSKKLKWDEFIDLCKTVQYPIESTLEDNFGISIRNKSDCKKAFVKILLSQGSEKKSLEQALKKSRTTLFRLQKSKTTPSLVDVLALIDLKPKGLKAFTDSFLHNKNKPYTQRSLFSVPWFGVVSSAMAQKEHLDLPEYSPEWISKKIQLTLSQVKIAVDVMIENELIEWNGKHFQPTRSRTVALNHQRSRSEFINALKFWVQKSLTAIEFHEQNNTGNNRFKGVFRTFATSAETVDKVNALIAEMEEKIHNLISSSEGEKDQIRSFVFTHFDAADTKKIVSS